MNVKHLVCALVISILMISFHVSPAWTCDECDNLYFQNLTTKIGRGFGNHWNKYAWSMAEFNGRIYVGTYNVRDDYPMLFEALINGEIDNVIKR